MPAITRRQQKIMNAEKNVDATFTTPNQSTPNQSTKQWFMDYTHVRLNELKALNNTMAEHKQNSQIEYGTGVPENICDIVNNMYFEELRLVNEIYYNINVYLEDIMNHDKPKRKYWLTLLKTIFIKQKDLERSIMVSFEPTTDEEISIVKSTLEELEKARNMAIRLLPSNEINSRPVRRSVKPVFYKGMEEDNK
jgi:hypothetical protein